MMSPKRPMALPKISTMRILTKRAGFAASERAAPEPTCRSSEHEDIRDDTDSDEAIDGNPNDGQDYKDDDAFENSDDDLSDADATDEVGETGGQASAEHRVAGEVVLGHQLGVLLHSSFGVGLDK